MNCLAYRRAMLEAPLREDDRRAAHAEQCAACRRFGRTVRELEGQLGTALAIEVPRSLSERLDHHAPRRQGRFARLLLPWLIPSLITLVAAALYLPWQHRQELAAAHRRSLQPTLPSQPLSDQALRNALVPFGLELRPPPPSPLTARWIELDGAPALQLRLQHEGRPATVLLFSASPLSSHTGPFVQGGVSGFVSRTEKGSVAVLGLSDAAARRLLARLFGPPAGSP